MYRKEETNSHLAFSMSSTMLGACAHLILTTTSGGRAFNAPFINEDTKAQSSHTASS